MLSRTADQKLGWVILLVACGVYAVYQVIFLTDPWSSWVHIETPYYDPTLRHTVATNSWASYSGVIFAEPIRLRPVMQGLELLDSYLRPAMVTTFGFLPSLANATSVLYFALCPILVILVAHRMLGASAIDAVLVVLAVGAVLTSIGYVSAAIFIFHPSKKIAIAATLVTYLAFLRYMHTPQRRYLIVIGLLQFILAMTDEYALASGLLFCALVAVYVIVFRRKSAFDLIWLAGFAVATFAAFVYRFGLDWTKLEGAHIYQGEGILQRLLGSIAALTTNLDSLSGHLAASFSSLYGYPATKYLFLIALAGAGVLALCGLIPPLQRRLFVRVPGGAEPDVTQFSFFLIASFVFLFLNVVVAVLLLRFGGSNYLSMYNYYYGATLPAFAFLVVCAAFRLTSFAVAERSPLLKLAGWSIRATLSLALIFAIAANIVNVPRVNRLVAMIHNNPYVYGAINEAGIESLRKAPVGAPVPGEVVRIPRCGVATFTREFNDLLDRLSASDVLRAAYLHYPSNPFVTEKYLAAYFEMMLRRTPTIEVVPGTAQQC